MGLGLGTAVRHSVPATTASGTGAAAGTGAATGAGKAILCAVGSATGTGAASGVGAIANEWTSVDWVDGAGSAYLTWDAAGGAIGTNSANFEAFFVLRDLDNLSAAENRLFTISGRHAIAFTSASRLNVQLLGAGPTTLVNWTSTNDAAGILKDAGEWVLHIAANLSGTPTMVASIRQITGGSSWVTITGTFGTGPTVGTLENARSTTGADYGVGATTSGTLIYGREIALAAINLDSAAVGRTALYDTILKHPQYLNNMTIKFYGDAAAWNSGVNLGAGGHTFTRTGTFSAA